MWQGPPDHLSLPSAVGNQRWITTVQGNALAQASFGRPISRATAERHLVQVIERAVTYNADPSHLLTVKEIAAFGSYLDPDADRLGDLDIAVNIPRRETDGGRYVPARVTRTMRSVMISAASCGVRHCRREWSVPAGAFIDIGDELFCNRLFPSPSVPD